MKFSKVNKNYWVSKKLSNGQSIVLAFNYDKEVTDETYYVLTMAIAKKRKLALEWCLYNEYETVGTYFDSQSSTGIGVNVFEARNFLISAINEFKDLELKKHGRVNIHVEGRNDRLFNIYSRVLTKHGFTKSRYRVLQLNLVR